MAQEPQFEIPTQLRELAEKNIEQARAACGQFMEAARKAQDMLATMLPANPLTGGIKEVQERAMRFTQQNIDANFALASELAKAKDLNEVLEIQSRRAQMQLETYGSQANELVRLMSEAAQKTKNDG